MKHSKLTPTSRLLARGCIDGRSREGRFLAACRAELLAGVVGNPTPAMRVMIDRLSWLRLHVLLIDERIASGQPMSLHDQRSYLAFSNSITRGMRTLGLEQSPTRTKPMDAIEFGRLLAAGEVT